MEGYEEIDYSPYPEEIFNVTIALGALDPNQQELLANSPLTHYLWQLKSSSPEAEQLIHEPLEFLLEREVPGVHAGSRIQTTVLNHHIPLRSRIIRAKATVDQDGDVALEIHKQTW